MNSNNTFSNSLTPPLLANFLKAFLMPFRLLRRLRPWSGQLENRATPFAYTITSVYLPKAKRDGVIVYANTRKISTRC